MTTLLQSPSSLLSHYYYYYYSSSTSPPSSSFHASRATITCKRTTPPLLLLRPPPLSKSKSKSKSKHVPRSAIDEVTDVLDSLPPVPSFDDLRAGPLKLKLLSAVSGLNTGLAASEDDLQKVDSAVKEIEAVAGKVDLSVDLDKLQGRWKLVYSSAFSSRTLGGSRPGPPIGRLLPITLGQVFQRIDTVSKDFDNIVEIQLGTPWPLPIVELTATLAHTFEIIGSSTVRIIFEKTTVKTTGNLSQLPPLEIPQLPDALRPSSNRGSGEFEVTYLDADTRITRGDRGELRVFVIA